ncbi:hypothetical protein L1049_004350 [Liquidambar formosana]|uniref:Uncharacterized protein n=1 Tax=Liquidambar formosana TaxID=63359 RepID=A0AAP0RNU9_LIQFO
MGGGHTLVLALTIWLINVPVIVTFGDSDYHKKAQRVLATDISGNIEIGNGYGVPGGGAYYGAPRPNISMLSMANQQNRELEQKPMANELPDYLKQKLRARGILKDETAKGANVNTESIIFVGNMQHEIYKPAKAPYLVT